VNTESTEVQDLLRLKRYEQPSDEYFEEFVDAFHRRQREDLLKCSARSLFVERLSVWLREMGIAKWAYGAGLAYAALMVGFLMWPQGGVDSHANAPVLSGGNRTLEHAEFAAPLNFDGTSEREAAEPTKEF
jgi:hypothetical protein